MSDTIVASEVIYDNLADEVGDIVLHKFPGTKYILIVLEESGTNHFFSNLSGAERIIVELLNAAEAVQFADAAEQSESTN